MSTLDELVQSVALDLQGFTADQEQMTYLTEDVTEQAMSLPVDDASQLSLGIAEVGDELVQLKEVDQSAETATVFPFGRGAYTSKAGSHVMNTAVVNNPAFPKAKIMQSINLTLQAVFPDLFQVKHTSFPYKATRLTYELPDDVHMVHEVSCDTIGPSERWPRVQRYRFDSNAETGQYPSGKSIDLMEGLMPGRTVHVTYLAPPGLLESGSDEFSGKTGLPLSAEDVVFYGACYRMVGYLENPRLQVRSVASSERSNNVEVGAALNASKFFFAQYQQRLAQERQALLRRFPPTSHKVR